MLDPACTLKFEHSAWETLWGATKPSGAGSPERVKIPQDANQLKSLYLTFSLEFFTLLHHCRALNKHSKGLRAVLGAAAARVELKISGIYQSRSPALCVISSDLIGCLTCCCCCCLPQSANTCLVVGMARTDDVRSPDETTPADLGC